MILIIKILINFIENNIIIIVICPIIGVLIYSLILLFIGNKYLIIYNKKILNFLKKKYN